MKDIAQSILHYVDTNQYPEPESIVSSTLTHDVLSNLLRELAGARAQVEVGKGSEETGAC